MIRFTSTQVNNFTKEQEQRFIIGYGDGQGDSYLESLAEMKDQYDEDTTNMEVIDELYDEYGGNMVNIKWISDDYKLVDIQFLD